MKRHWCRCHQPHQLSRNRQHSLSAHEILAVSKIDKTQLDASPAENSWRRDAISILPYKVSHHWVENNVGDKGVRVCSIHCMRHLDHLCTLMSNQWAINRELNVLQRAYRDAWLQGPYIVMPFAAAPPVRLSLAPLQKSLNQREIVHSAGSDQQVAML